MDIRFKIPLPAYLCFSGRKSHFSLGVIKEVFESGPMFSINSGLTFALVAMERNCWYGGGGRGWGMAVLALGPQLLNHTQKGTIVEI